MRMPTTANVSNGTGDLNLLNTSSAGDGAWDSRERQSHPSREIYRFDARRLQREARQ
jgi:hypothetical protein